MEKYLKDNIDDNIYISELKDLANIPIYLKELYSFSELRLLGNELLLVEPLNQFPLIEDIKKHFQLLEEIFHKPVVLKVLTITRYIRKALIVERIPFIVANGQIYLPFLGMDLSVATEKRMVEKVKFTTATQITYLLFLYNKNLIVNANQIRDLFGYSIMTGQRALLTLLNAKLVNYTIGGTNKRTKNYKAIGRAKYFEIGSNYLENPIKDVVYVETTPKNSFIAGLEALSDKSNLNGERTQVRAIYYKELDNNKLNIKRKWELTGYEKVIELQLWKYNPAFFSHNNYVDTASLYASFKDSKDERVEKALEEVMEKEPWYMD